MLHFRLSGTSNVTSSTSWPNQFSCVGFCIKSSVAITAVVALNNTHFRSRGVCGSGGWAPLIRVVGFRLSRQRWTSVRQGRGPTLRLGWERLCCQAYGFWKNLVSGGLSEWGPCCQLSARGHPCHLTLSVEIQHDKAASFIKASGEDRNYSLMKRNHGSGVLYSSG